MRVRLKDILRPRGLCHYAIQRDGRDELVYCDGKLWFYRSGEGTAKYSIVTLPIGIKPDSTHKLRQVQVKAFFGEPDLYLPNRFFENKYFVTILGDEGKYTDKAKINPESGTIWVNREFVESLPELWYRYILFHEVAHLWADDEPTTDALATYLYIKAGYPPSQALHTLKFTLSDSNPEKQARREKAVQTVLNYIRICVRPKTT